MINKKSLGEHPFTVEARVAIQLGRESISSSLIAIGELVKNAYDADGDEVVISFKGLGTDLATLVITDDGDGMNDKTILAKWMRIGTSNKSNDIVSRRNRIFTGAKGLGRLGLDRLCSNLSLYSKTIEDSCIYEVDIKWKQYDESKDVDLTTIKHEIFEIDALTLPEKNFPLPAKNKGCQYVMSGLKDKWDADFLNDLKKELSLLVSPFKQELGFKIKIDTNGFYPEIDGYVSSDHFLDATEWRLEASVKPNNKVEIGFYDNKGKLCEEVITSEWKDWIQGNNEVPMFGPVDFKIYFMRNFANRDLNTNKFKSKDIRNFLKNNQGIRIYRDYFRVKPYGEPSGQGDWLGLAMRRVINPEGISQDGWRIGPNQVVGALFISREKNPNLVDQTNREGLTETTAFFELRAFALKSIEIFEALIQKKAREIKPVPKEEPNISSNIEESLLTYKGILGQLDELKDSTTDDIAKTKLLAIEATINAETEKATSLKSHIDRLEAEKDTLANLASLGILSVAFGHETLGSISNAISNADLLKIKISENVFMLPNNAEEYAFERIQEIEKSLSFIKVFGSFSLGNVRRDKRTRRLLDIAALASNVIVSFNGILSKRKITCEIENESSEILQIKGYAIDWESIFANLITNSCWALLNTPAEKRRIKIKLIKDNDFGIIDFQDSGCGIEAGVKDHIFKATFTTKRNKRGDAVGTGMGLSIVKTFIEVHSGGTISLSPPGELGGARFIISVPLAEIGENV